jgi:hypothetical protein
MPDDKEVIGLRDRLYEVHAKDIKIVLQGLTFSPSVLQKLMHLFKDRYMRTIFFEMSFPLTHKILCILRDSQILKNCQRSAPPLTWLPSDFFYSRNPYADILRSVQEQVPKFIVAIIVIIFITIYYYCYLYFYYCYHFYFLLFIICYYYLS